jgi:hypothetical protein
MDYREITGVVFIGKQGRQCTCNETLRHVHAITVAVEKL